MNEKTPGNYEVEGNLTMKGTTNKIAFPVEANVSEGKVTAKGTALIDRTKWNIQFRSGKFFQDLGDKLIYDDFEITFELKASAGESLTAK